MREPETFSMTDSTITARADVYARAIGQISLFIIGIIVTIYQMWSIRAVALRGWVGGTAQRHFSFHQHDSAHYITGRWANGFGFSSRIAYMTDH